jgi:NNP family nitrate/nitrite transporter-like MFS transporter
MSEKMTQDDLVQSVKELEKQVNKLHTALEKKGVNSRGTSDIFGREFAVPVDAEHKATQFIIFNASLPHQRAFHVSWWAFFSSFFSMFAAPALAMYMKKETSLNLKKTDIGTGNILAVSSNIVMRAVTGFLCDMIGPRRAVAFLLLVTCPALVGMMFVQDAAGWIGCRAIIGFSLATFVCSQTWMSQMYNKSVVGIANATSAGWGNLGGGVTALLMPLIFLGFYGSLSGSSAEKEDMAWRLCYIVPLCMHIVGAAGALTARDLPDGNNAELEASGAKQKSKGSIVLKTGLSNVNAWVLTLTYGMCFGVELTMNSVAVLYFHEYHGLPPWLAGLLGALYGLMNLFARSLGGLLSDWSNKYFGMRGRLWSAWIVQTLEGFLCMTMAWTTMGYDSPFGYEKSEKVQGMVQVPNNGGAGLADAGHVHDISNEATKWVLAWKNGDTKEADDVPITVFPCGCVSQALSTRMQKDLGIGDDMLMVYNRNKTTGMGYTLDGTELNCIQDNNVVGMSVLCMILFSLCVQAAEGLHYGIVPYVSRPALGVVSGMVGAGGNLGAVISLSAFFKGKDMRTDVGFQALGIMVIAITGLMHFIYFPDMGCMLLPRGALGKYDPQIIKPPADYRGADHMDFSAVKDPKKEKEQVGA